MKNSVYKITLITLAFLSFRLTANQTGQPDNIKESIRFAIKKSKPDLLKKALVNIELTEKEKNWFSMFANEVIQMRKNKMNLNLIKPRPRKVAHRGYFFTSLGILGLAGIITTCITQDDKLIKEAPGTIFSIFIITITSAILTVKKLMDITDKKNKEYFAMHPYRSPKQKYLDSINVLELLQTN